MEGLLVRGPGSLSQSFAPSLTFKKPEHCTRVR